jgi:hypothetical protein
MKNPMIEQRRPTRHEQVSLLLPWFVNDTLATAEHELVRRHLANCRECRNDVALLSSVQSAVAKSSPTPIVPGPDAAILLDALDRNESSKPAPGRRSVLAASLAVAFVIIVAVWSLQHQTELTTTRFHTATSVTEAAAMDYVLNVTFTAGTDAMKRDQVLRDIGAKDIIPADEDGTYRITVKLRISSLEELDRYTREMEALPQMQSIEVVAMQLPLEAPQ